MELNESTDPQRRPRYCSTCGNTRVTFEPAFTPVEPEVMYGVASAPLAWLLPPGPNPKPFPPERKGAAKIGLFVPWAACPSPANVMVIPLGSSVDPLKPDVRVSKFSLTTPVGAPPTDPTGNRLALAVPIVKTVTAVPMMLPITRRENFIMIPL